MDRIAIELPLKPSIRDALVARIFRNSSQDVIDLSGSPSAIVFPVDDCPWPATRAEVVANNRSRIGSIAWRDVSPLISELGDADALTVLTAMQERFTSDPTEENSDLLQAAINQIVASPELRRRHSDEAQRAKQLFHTGEGLKDTAIVDNIWYEAYTNVNFGGPEFFTSMTPNWAYWRQPDFRNVRAVYSSATTAQDAISSVQFGSTGNEAGGHVVFFEHVQYGGRYRNFSVPRGGQRDVPWIGGDFDDLASSALIIRRFPNELPPVSVARNMTIPPLSAPGLTADGNPIFTWDMWPTGGSWDGSSHPNSVEKTFIQIIIPMRVQLNVKVGLLPSVDIDYRVQAKYWIFPFVRDGKLAATVDFYGWYVEAGLLTSYITDTLKERIKANVPTVQQGIDSAIAPLAAVAPRLSFCYLLPGRNEERGDVHDDVTLVGVQ
jgi:hypothetical protein